MYLKIQKLVKIIIIKRRVKVPLLIVFEENNKDTRVFKTSSVFILFYVISVCIMWKIFYMTLSIRVWQYCLCTRWYTATDWLWSNPPTALVFENDSELNPQTDGLTGQQQRPRPRHAHTPNNTVEYLWSAKTEGSWPAPRNTVVTVFARGVKIFLNIFSETTKRMRRATQWDNAAAVTLLYSVTEYFIIK